MFLFVRVSVRGLGQKHGPPLSSGSLLSGIWRSTWPAQDIRCLHSTQCAAIEQRKQQDVETVIRPELRGARRARSNQSPTAAAISRRRQPQRDTGHAPPDASAVNATAHPSATGLATRRVRASAEPPELQTQQAAPILPALMDFEVMYQQLQDWKQRHMTAHVPRFCFDAPELGAWVRRMRKQYKLRKLEQWQIERLNQLQFEWKINNQDAKWYHLYHQLRRYQLLHGSTEVDIKHNEDDGCDWSQVAWFLRRQARMLAKQKLSSRRHNMLSQLGVTLRFHNRIVTKGTQQKQMRKT